MPRTKLEKKTLPNINQGGRGEGIDTVLGAWGRLSEVFQYFGQHLSRRRGVIGSLSLIESDFDPGCLEVHGLFKVGCTPVWGPDPRQSR